MTKVRCIDIPDSDGGDLSCRRAVNSSSFYPRPVLAFGYCRCLRMCVCVCLCVRQSWACPSGNSSTVQARITKFGPEKQNTLVKIPIVFWGNWPWPSRSNLTSNSKLTQFWACPNHYSPPILFRISKLGQKMHFSTVKIPVNSGLDWPCALRLWNSRCFVSILFRDCFTVSTPVHMGNAQPKWNGASSAGALNLN